MKRILLSLYHYFCFFLLMAFIITCCTMLFVTIMSNSMGLDLTEENINTAAKLTFLNVVFLSLVCTIIDAIRRKLTIERPVRQIVAAAAQIARGDYSVRVPVIHSINRADGLDEISECFNKMAQELSSVETLRTDFIANVSHELKTPLTVIRNYGKLLQQPQLDDNSRMEYARAVSDSARRMAGMVTNILKLNRLENQQIYPQKAQYDLSEQLREALLQFENVWEQKNIEIEADIQDSVAVTADRELLELVWSNLLSNAFKFTDPGGTVVLKLTASAHHAIVTVTDTGCGMTPEVGAHIFEKFYQGDTSHTTQGNGLGLALVKRVVDILQGEITVESTLGKGSSFQVRIRRQ